jgi:hypothetical protein
VHNTTGIVLRAYHERSRITLLDGLQGKIKGLCFSKISPGTVVHYRITPSATLPHIHIQEIIAVPFNSARHNIWWLHFMIALIDAYVPLGSGIGEIYNQFLWLCTIDPMMDNMLQMRYCAKLLVTLGLHASLKRLCEHCIAALHYTAVNNLSNLLLDSECTVQLSIWIHQSIREHGGTDIIPISIKSAS